MKFLKDQDGTWSLKIETDADKATIERSHAWYPETLPRYLTAFDLAFSKAAETSEFALVSTLLRVRGVQDPGWDPYESSLEAITQIRSIHEKTAKDDKIESFYAARHLQLWIYGHIVEASEPYEILANLIAVSQGETFKIDRFPPKNGRPQSPGAKIDHLEKAANTANSEKAVTPLKEVWDREFRNAIFHSDYSVHGGEVRFRREGWPVKYDHDEILTLVNRALAYFDAPKVSSFLVYRQLHPTQDDSNASAQRSYSKRARNRHVPARSRSNWSETRLEFRGIAAWTHSLELWTFHSGGNETTWYRPRAGILPG